MRKRLCTMIVAALANFLLLSPVAMAAGNGQEKASQTDARAIRCAESDGASPVATSGAATEKDRRDADTPR